MLYHSGTIYVYTYVYISMDVMKIYLSIDMKNFPVPEALTVFLLHLALRVCLFIVGFALVFKATVVRINPPVPFSLCEYYYIYDLMFNGI
jgi:hypothetical protein